MSVQFRQRTPGEYLKILKRRKWLIILPVIAVAAAVTWVVLRLPDVYESTTLIVVKPSTLPQSVIPTMTDDTLTRQLSSITQVVGSRSSLEPLVEKYHLYQIERQRGEPMESIIAMMRRDINVEVNTSRREITDGFDIKYRYRDRKITQAVTTELASKFVSEQTQNTLNTAQAARNFIDAQVRQTKEELDAIDAKRLQFMQDNLGTLPQEANSLLGQLTGLREQQKALITEIGRLQDRRSTLANQLSILQKERIDAIEDTAQNVTDPKTTLAWSELVKRKADMQAELQHLLTEYTEKHPDVLAKKSQIESIQQDMDKQLAEWKERIAEKEKKLRARTNMPAEAVTLEMRNVDNEIKRQQVSLSETDKNIGAITDRINKIPGADVALGAIEREYQTKKSAYDKLLDEQQKIGLGADAASQQQSSGIEVIDPANLPSMPVAPKRLMLVALGIAAGLGLGLLLAGIFEVPLLLTIQSTEDARHYTGLPVLISVPELMTPQEARSLPRRRRLLLAAGVVATVVSIPLLALALRLTHIFEMLSQSSGRV
jgi:polysaccharide chain length determinant protein (PEP-CTERM system associated)